jgi:N-methylhydantoinase A/oxoprolinase/acetone carboxylase beta subunit
VVSGRRPEMTLSSDDREVIDRLARGPQALWTLTDDIERGWLLGRRIKELEARGLVRRAGFTPTDALHVLGAFNRWDSRAARLGAELMASEHNLDALDLCRQVVRAFGRRVTTELVSKIVADDAGRADVEPDLGANVLLKRALDGGDGRDLACALTLQRPLVAIGAPVAAYLPDVARHLNTELVIPPFADVANAVGAVAGGIVQRLRLLINPMEDGALRLHLIDGVRDFAVLEEAVRHAQDVTFPLVEDMARQAGADHIELRMERHDQRAPTAHGQGEEVYLGTELVFTAAGRPSMARR